MIFQRISFSTRRFVKNRKYSISKYKPGNFKLDITSTLKIVDFKNEYQTEPFVCVLGWLGLTKKKKFFKILGSQWKYLDKYSNWYSSCNISTLCYIPKLTSMFFFLN